MHFCDFTAEGVASKSKPSSKRVIIQNPVLCGLFVSENTYVGCGYDNAPLLFKRQGDGSWKMTGSLDAGYGRQRASNINKDAFGGRSVFFEGAQIEEGVASVNQDTLHQNYINDCQAYVRSPDGNVQVITTSDPNGNINYWDVSAHL